MYPPKSESCNNVMVMFGLYWLVQSWLPLLLAIYCKGRSKACEGYLIDRLLTCMPAAARAIMKYDF